MKKVIRLNEEKLAHLIEAALDDLNLEYGRANEARQDLTQLIKKILMCCYMGNSHQEGKYFMVDLRVYTRGGHYLGKMEIHDKIGDMRYSHLVTADLDLTMYAVFYQRPQVISKYAQKVNDWTTEILSKLGYHFI